MSTPSSESVLPVSAVTEHRPTSRILRNVTANWVSLVINILLSFLIAPVVVNQLGDTYYGIWTLLMQLTGYLWLFDFGVRESVVKYVAQYHAAGQKQELSTIVRTAVSLYSVVAVVAMTAVALLAFLLPYAFNIPPEAVTTARATAFLTGATIAQGFVFNVFVGVVMGLQQFYRLAWANIAFAVGRALLTYLLVTNGLGIVSLALLQFGVSLAFNVLVYRLCVAELPYLSLGWMRPHRDDVVKLLNYGKFVLVANVGDKIVFATDSVVIGALMPISALTYFAIGGSLIEYFRSFINSMASVINPVTSSLEARNETATLSALFQTGAKAAMVLGVPVCIGFMTLGERFITLWMGPEYGPQAGTVLAVLAAGYLLGLPYSTISGVMYGLGQHRYVAYSRIAEGIANLVLSVILGMRYGLVGVAVGTAVPHAIVVAGLLPSFLPRMFPMSLRHYYLWTYGRPLLAAIPFAVTCWTINSVIAPGNLVLFGAYGVSSLITYAVPCWFVALTPDERRHLSAAAMRYFRQPVTP
jgi:O-antigen/teichoic acid export membrane protein